MRKPKDKNRKLVYLPVKCPKCDFDDKHKTYYPERLANHGHDGLRHQCSNCHHRFNMNPNSLTCDICEKKLTRTSDKIKHEEICFGTLDNPRLNYEQVLIMQLLEEEPMSIREIKKRLKMRFYPFFYFKYTNSKIWLSLTNPYYEDEQNRHRIIRPGLLEFGLVEKVKDPRYHSRTFLFISKSKTANKQLKTLLNPLQEKIIFALYEFQKLAFEEGDFEMRWVKMAELQDYLNMEFELSKSNMTVARAIDNKDPTQWNGKYSMFKGLIQQGYVHKRGNQHDGYEYALSIAMNEV